MSAKIREITKQQRLQVIGLLALAQKHYEQADECQAAIKEDRRARRRLWPHMVTPYDAATLLKRTKCIVKSAEGK